MSALSASMKCSPSQFELWHCRLGHPSSPIVSTVLKLCHLPYTFNSTKSLCTSCCVGKSHKLPFYNNFTPCSAPLEVVHSDIGVPSPIIPSQGFRYYVHFIDAYSRFTWIYLIHNKFDVAKNFPQFKAQAELQLNHKLKVLHTDGGGEYIALKSYLNQHGIIHRVSCLHTPEQNGIAERKHKHIVDMGLTLLTKASLPHKY